MDVDRQPHPIEDRAGNYHRREKAEQELDSLLADLEQRRIKSFVGRIGVYGRLSKIEMPV